MTNPAQPTLPRIDAARADAAPSRHPHALPSGEPHALLSGEPHALLSGEPHALPSRETQVLPSRRPQATPPSRAPIESESLFGGANEVQIAHRGALYRLKQTSLGKLILTK